MTIRKAALAFTATIAIATTGVASAQTTDTGVTEVETTEREDDDDFPWGLLGLLGLAGLLGRKKHDRDVHVNTHNDRR
jgi:hypothetical protein